MDEKEDDGIRLTAEEQKRRRARSIALALVLAAVVIVFYVVSFVKGPGIVSRPL